MNSKNTTAQKMDRLDYWCRECYRQYNIEYRNTTLKGWMFQLIRNTRNRRKKAICDLDVNFLVHLWHTQNGFCHLSNYAMHCSSNSDWKCSLERLDNNRGYETDNVALICQEFNTRIQWTHALIDTLPDKINENVN
eukprot:397176_1